MCLEQKLSGSDLYSTTDINCVGPVVNCSFLTKGKDNIFFLIKHFQCNYKTFPGNVTFSVIFHVFSMCLENQSSISMVFQDVWEP